MPKIHLHLFKILWYYFWRIENFLNTTSKFVWPWLNLVHKAKWLLKWKHRITEKVCITMLFYVSCLLAIIWVSCIFVCCLFGKGGCYIFNYLFNSFGYNLSSHIFSFFLSQFYYITFFQTTFYFTFQIYWQKAVHRCLFFKISTGSLVSFPFYSYYCLFVLSLIFS